MTGSARRLPLPTYSACGGLRQDPRQGPHFLTGRQTARGKGGVVVVGHEPRPFEAYESGVLLHGTKADLAVGDLVVPGRISNFGVGRTANHVYVTETLDAAT